jgi:serine/threonine protein phosphatase 1
MSNLCWISWRGLIRIIHGCGKLGVRERRRVLRDVIPRQHIEFMNSMPVCLALPGVIFVHAGIQRGVSLKDQSDHQMLWMRHQGTMIESGEEDEPLVVHGHTPVQEPLVNGRRICIDTNAVYSGKLTAICLTPTGDYRFISTG